MGCIPFSLLLVSFERKFLILMSCSNDSNEVNVFIKHGAKRYLGERTPRTVASMIFKGIKSLLVS